ncbi:MAG: type II toxin-antitoxin system antitoxin SocA domain-containing protein [Patescibacteria group bacterium]|nr:DUF4065 domain-containing protein [Patescibacteria group bacterium]
MAKTDMEKLREYVNQPDVREYLERSSLAANLSVQIKLRREELGWTQRELAEQMGVPQSTVARLESCEAGFSTSMLQRFCSATGLRLDFQRFEPVIKNDFCDPIDVCRCILDEAHKLMGDCYDISKLKLQKLLYYVQLEHLGRFSSPIIENKFQAWEYGPVYPAVYRKFKKLSIISPEDCGGDASSLSKKQKTLIRNVAEKYARYSAWQLKEMTHAEIPWLNAWKKGKNSVISLEDMRVAGR